MPRTRINWCVRRLLAKKDVLIMSVGKFIEGESIFKLAQKQGVRVLIPSGAIAGIDAIKAASLQRIDRITLTTRKPIYGFADNTYVQEQADKFIPDKERNHPF